jgi:hypothetical protein
MSQDKIYFDPDDSDNNENYNFCRHTDKQYNSIEKNYEFSHLNYIGNDIYYETASETEDKGEHINYEMSRYDDDDCQPIDCEYVSNHEVTDYDFIKYPAEVDNNKQSVPNINIEIIKPGDNFSRNMYTNKDEQARNILKILDKSKKSKNVREKYYCAIDIFNYIIENNTLKIINTDVFINITKNKIIELRKDPIFRRHAQYYSKKIFGLEFND